MYRAELSRAELESILEAGRHLADHAGDIQSRLRPAGSGAHVSANDGVIRRRTGRCGQVHRRVYPRSWIQQLLLVSCALLLRPLSNERC